MPPLPWPELRHPFDPHGATWWIQELTEDAGAAVMAPSVSADALTRRFDAVLGAEGWGFSLQPFGDRAIICNLRLGDAERSAVAELPTDVKVSVTALGERALVLAAAAFGIGPSRDDRFWSVVDYDVEMGEGVYLPSEELWAEAMAAGASLGEAEPVPTAVVETAAATLPPASAAPAAPERSQGAQAIDKLVERLNEEGLGRQAARLVVAHHGYGRNPDEGRELYSKLRALLLEKRGAGS
ncbi:MAG: hypothetical protein KF813_11890 [Trueperaceae bacterium]|nr:hypothetical protein [Trueperaceae bacterium]